MQYLSYVLVADANTGRIYGSDDRLQTLHLTQELTNPAAHQSASDLDSDRPGVQKSGSGGVHGLGGDSDTSKHQQQLFAAQLAAVLHKDHLAGNFKALRIAAPPHFLGLLRQELHRDCQQVLLATVNKNLLAQRPEALAAYFD